MKAIVKFYKCGICGNTIALIKNGGGQLVCCNQPMNELVPNTTEASYEKHIPAVSKDGSVINVQVGSAPHPMLPEHYIEWVAVVGDDGAEIIKLNPGVEPKAVFAMKKNAEAYAYCNLHGLWKSDV